MTNRQTNQFLKGRLVEVRSARDILETLDSDGCLDGMPFMPEMGQYCGRRFQIFRRANKSCVEGYGLRSLRSTVFLEGLRCNGSAHDGCERDCQIFWKEAWLKPVTENEPTREAQSASEVGATGRLSQLTTQRDGRYVCQSTQLAGATAPMSAMNFAHFFTEIRNGELTIPSFLRIAARFFVNRLRTLAGRNLLDVLTGGSDRNSKGRLNLIEGEWVEVLNAEEIRGTVDRKGRNCGLSFEPDMLRYTGRRFQVSKRITRIIREETGEMAPISNTVVLDGVYCQGVCAKNCPRANPHYWREAWLKRVQPVTTVAGPKSEDCGRASRFVMPSALAPTAIRNAAAKPLEHQN